MMLSLKLLMVWLASLFGVSLDLGMGVETQAVIQEVPLDGESSSDTRGGKNREERQTGDHRSLAPQAENEPISNGI